MAQGVGTKGIPSWISADNPPIAGVGGDAPSPSQSLPPVTAQRKGHGSVCLSPSHPRAQRSEAQTSALCRGSPPQPPGMATGSPALEQSHQGAFEPPEQRGLRDPRPTPSACRDTSSPHHHASPASLPPPAPQFPPSNHAAQLAGVRIWLRAPRRCVLPPRHV